jgi:hypothetical protein
VAGLYIIPEPLTVKSAETSLQYSNSSKHSFVGDPMHNCFSQGQTPLGSGFLHSLLLLELMLSLSTQTPPRDTLV